MKFISGTQSSDLPGRLRALDFSAIRAPGIGLVADEKARSLVLLGLVILLATALRIYGLGDESYWRDEVAMVRVAGGSLESIYTDFRENGRPPVYVVMAHFWMQIFGTSEAATRSLSAIAGIASVLLIYVVGQVLFNRRVGLLSALLLTISDMQIYYSQEFRYYSLFVFAGLLSYLLYVLSLRDGKTWVFALYSLSSILLFLTHTFGLFILMAQGLHFLIYWQRHRRSRIKWLASLAPILLVVGITLMPAVLLVVVDRLAPSSVSGVEGAAGTTTIGPTFLVARSWSAPLGTIRDYFTTEGPSWKAFLLGGAVLALGTAAYAAWIGKSRWLSRLRYLSQWAGSSISSASSRLLMLLLWLLCPVVTPLIVSMLMNPIYHDRYTIAAAPALYLLLASGISAVRKVIPMPVLVSLVLVLVASGLRQHYSTPRKEQWREVAAYIDAQGREGDLIVNAPGYQSEAFKWYYKGDLPECGLVDYPENSQEIVSSLKECAHEQQRLWVVLRPGNLPSHEFVSYFMESTPEGMHLLREKHFRDVSALLFELEER